MGPRRPRLAQGGRYDHRSVDALAGPAWHCAKAPLSSLLAFLALHFAMALTLAQDMPDHDIVGKTPLGFSELVRGVRESARTLTTSA